MKPIFASFIALWLLAAASPFAAEPDAAAGAAGVEFFEKRIRPLLAENCYQCHGPKKQESGLALSTPMAIQKGGDRGSLLAPGDPDGSLLIQAVRYTDDDLKMPPRGKLKDEQIADLVAWVKLGAPAPRDEAPEPSIVQPAAEFDLAERRKHWAYHPVQHAPPPTAGSKPAPGVPPAWHLSPIDAYILARLHAAGLSPSPSAEKRSLIRRATFDLTGLPPLPDEVSAFVANETPDAYERLVDRLLASPRYGERFGRHWLDVVRYSETLGFEFDYDLHNSWRYRDYVIRALNGDLPYDQFVIEHLAGDLVEQSRRNPFDGTNESILATGFFWMYEGKQTPIDIRQYQADCIDNQIDVLGKAFLGQTIACARCHDHKFDAIATRDYYALAGYLRSSRYQQAFIDSPDAQRPQIEQLAALRAEIERAAKAPAAEIWRAQSAQMSRYLLAAASADAKDEEKIAAAAKATDLELDRLKQWVKALADDSVGNPDHPLFAWSQRAKADAMANEELLASLKKLEEQAPQLATAARSLEEFRQSDLAHWFRTGSAWGVAPALAGQSVLGVSAARPIARLTSGGTDSGLLANRLQGEIRSPTFTIDKKFVHLRLAGKSARVNLVIDGYTLIMNPMYGKLTAAPTSNRLAWRTMPVDRWVGHRAFIEASDSTIPPHGLNPPPSPARMPVGPDGYLAIDQILLSDDPNPPALPSGLNRSAIELRENDNLTALATAYERLAVRAVDRWQAGTATTPRDRDDDVGLLNWLLENGLLDSPVGQTFLSAAENDNSLATLLDQFHKIESTLPTPLRAPAIADGTGEDEFVFLRGNYRTPGDPAPRDLPVVLPKSGESSLASGSGRLDLARRLVDPNNPLVPRVLVNRLWQHHFGEGLVRTPDDFGRMGQPPTHPELLDHLAAELVRADWSMKNVSRRMVTSATYRQSSNAESNTPTPHSALRNPHSVDPENRLLHHMPIRRLEAEAIRDSMLALSGRLSDQMHGPSVLPHLTSHMEGRGKPQSGALDGDGRRSIYINARRNFLTPLLLSFDYPVTFTPIGRRGAATIPAQALTLMNDPFVVEEATRWATKALEESGSSTEQRIESLYRSAFARPPTADEIASAIDFLQAQSLRHGGGSENPKVWADLCHVLINVKEFIFID